MSKSYGIQKGLLLLNDLGAFLDGFGYDLAM